MTIEQLIKEKIVSELNPEFFELTNESYKHIGHAGDDGSGQTHFKLKVVSSAFDGLSKVERQRVVYNHLNHLFSMGLHALSMELESK